MTRSSATPLSPAEARAVLIADEALVLSYETRQASGQTLGLEELDAWAALVASAIERNTAREGRPRENPPPEEPDRYPGGNEPDFQTLFIEAFAQSKRR